MPLDAPPVPFSTALREATWARHEGIADDGDPSPDAEPGILGALFDGDLHLDDFTAWTAQQYFVYEALDEAGRSLRDDPVVGWFASVELSRLPAFDADLSLLIGPDWRDRISPNESTKRYADRIREVGSEWPGGFVAHHYTRYLGDMSGGQAFRTAANDLYGFADGPGVSFYIFDGIDDLAEFKTGYRAQLDAAGWDAAERQRIIDEVLDAYDHNEAVLAELATTMRRSV
ncbi:heme oxygenase (biliverdin-producing) [Stackebrandtia nassauensis]|uniref:Heme oxygenase n=1 Tax=Stackebrandtia nassauensis (strain DSM 44728 / CIP 108903 / NRRL B-16338 / NBRC 102104 / LLR-40K-21) TaxID=446470 RepID=D3Q6L3_STANL|nr:biliverdin-producing heme oxygenase [Stackebrandtia nassauensis]ADD44256.1 Heme oxygenase [Stackebrandtia nassauensis DSM 44728]